MAPKRPYPHSNAECVALLKTLGFKKRLGIGRGKHPEKYTHPTRPNTNPDDRPFVLVTHDYFDEIGKRLMKKLLNWGFTQDELEQACQGIAPTEQQTNPGIDIEPENA